MDLHAHGSRRLLYAPVRPQACWKCRHRDLVNGEHSSPIEPRAPLDVSSRFRVTPTFSQVISMHIFNLLFLSLRPIKWSLPAVVGGVWSFILADVLIGPAAFTDFFGPYDGSDGDGTACWITKKHSTARFLLEYFPVRDSAPSPAFSVLTQPFTRRPA